MRPDERVLAFAAQGLGAEVRGCAAIGGGRNSRVFRLETDRGPFALKQYRDPHRLRTESAAFAFLRGQGVTEVPEVLLADESVPAGIYSFIEGERVDGTNVAQRDVDDCVRFVGRLRTSGKSAEAAAMGAAAESCFSLDAVEANIAGRLERLDERDRRTDCEKALTDFLDDAFLPALDAVTARARETYAELGVAPDEALPLRERVPSPSDFGFHNAVRAGDGMVFLDFEYFGWDDPAKLTADFLLHPGMDISWRSRMRFARGVVRVLGDAALAGRVDALLPLFGLKWCMILLNEFVRGDMERREFAGASEAKEAILERQLGKARAMLEIALGHAREGLDL